MKIMSIFTFHHFLRMVSELFLILPNNCRQNLCSGVLRYQSFLRSAPFDMFIHSLIWNRVTEKGREKEPEGEQEYSHLLECVKLKPGTAVYSLTGSSLTHWPPAKTPTFTFYVPLQDLWKGLRLNYLAPQHKNGAYPRKCSDLYPLNKHHYY